MKHEGLHSYRLKNNPQNRVIKKADGYWLLLENNHRSALVRLEISSHTGIAAELLETASESQND